MEADPDEQTAAIRLLKKVFGTRPRFIIADNVAAAVGDLEVHEFMLIVSEVTMLGTRTGIDLFRHVQQNYPHLVDHFVFLTNDEVGADVHRRYVTKAGATADDVKQAIRAPRAGSPAEPARPAVTMSMADIAQAVNSVLSNIQEQEGPSGLPMGRFGNGVFIAAVWRALERTPGFRAMTLSRFKQRLVEANQQGLVDLGRLDAQGDVDPKELEESEIVDRGARFHTVKDRSARPRQRDLAGPRDFAEALTQIVKSVRPGVGHTGKPMGRFGDRKVFIAAAWRAAQRDPRFAGMTRTEFDRRLIQSLRDGGLVLARADLVDAMDAAEVAESEIRDQNASYHFIVDPSAKDPWAK